MAVTDYSTVDGLSSVAVLVSSAHRLNSKSFLYWPSKLYAPQDRFVSKPGFTAPLLERLSLSKRFYNVIISSVVLLLKLSCPPAVFRLIISTRVFTIYGVVGRGLLSHISQKVIKLLPSLTNRDPLCPVFFISRSGCIFASLSNVYPGGIFAGFFGFSCHRGSVCR